MNDIDEYVYIDDGDTELNVLNADKQKTHQIQDSNEQSTEIKIDKEYKEKTILEQTE